MANVGYATLTISPSMRGMQQSLQRQMSGVMPAAGARAGQQLGAAVDSGTRRGLGQMTGMTAAVSAATASARSTIAGGFEAAGQRAQAAVGGIGDSVRTMATTAGAAFAAIGLAGVVGEIGRVAAGAQQTEAVLDGLYQTAGHGAGEATEMMRLLWEQFSGSGIDMGAWQRGAQNLAYLGLNAQETTDLMKFLEAAISATGGGADEVGRVTDALQTMQNMGKASMDEINTLSGSGIPMFDLLTSHIGVTNEELADMISNGEVLVDDVLAAIEAKGGTWAQGLIDGAENVNQTFGSAWGSIRATFVNGLAQQVVPLLDRLAPHMLSLGEAMSGAFEALPGVISRVKGAMDSSGVTAAIRSIARNLRDFVTGLLPMAGGFIAGFGAALGALVLALEPVARLLGGLGRWMSDNQEVVQAFGAALGVVVAAFVALKTALAIGGIIAALANPISLVVLGIAALAAGLVWLWQESETFRDIVSGAWAVVMAVWDAFYEKFEEYWPKIQSGLQILREAFETALEAIGGAIETGVAIIQELWDRHGEDLLEVARTAWEMIEGVIDGAMQIIEGIIKVVSGIISGDWEVLWEGIKLIASGALTIVGAVIRGALGIIARLWKVALSLLWQGIVAGWNAIVTYIRRAMTRIATGVATRVIGIVVSMLSMRTRIMGALRGIGRWLYQAGRNLIGGLINGITSRVQDVASAAASIAGGVRNFLPFSPAKEGPLRTHPPDQAGATISQMIADGMRSGLPQVTSAAGAIAGATSRGPAIPSIHPAAAARNAPPAAPTVPEIVFRADGGRASRLLVELIQHSVRTELGGDVNRLAGRRG